MKIVLNFDAKPLIDAIMANFPEYSSDELTCVGFNYSRCEYQFVDEQRITHILYRPKLERGLQTLLQSLLAGRYPAVAAVILRNLQDANNWDLLASQLLVEYAIRGGRQ